MNSQVTDLVAVLADGLKNGGASTRATFGNKTAAFSYAGRIVNGLCAVVPSAVTESSTFPTMTVTESAPVTAWTTGQKPITAALTASAVNLSIFPGVIEIPTRAAIDTANLGTAVSRALFRQAVAAFDKTLVTDLLAVPGGVAKAATLATIAEAQAILLANGYTPDTLVVSGALYGTLAGTSGVITAGADPQAPIASVLGSRLVVSGALNGAQAIVLDSSSVLAVEHNDSPVAMLDVKARTNVTEVVVELVAGHAIVDPSGVVTVKAAA